MIISEKQIMQLFTFASCISTTPEFSYITESAKQDVANLVNDIILQQPSGLIEIKDEK